MWHKRHVKQHGTQCSFYTECIKVEEKKTPKILLGSTLGGPGLKFSSPCHISSDVYAAPIFNLSHRLRAGHVFLCYSLELFAVCRPYTFSRIKGKRCAMCLALQKTTAHIPHPKPPPPLTPPALVHPLSLINNSLIWHTLTKVKQPHTVAAQLVKRWADFEMNTN